MSRRFRCLGAILVIVVAAAIGVSAELAADDLTVKMSRSGICHCPGGQYYDRTTHFTPFRTIDDCLDGGGRHPKRGQGDCPTAEPPADSGMIALGLMFASAHDENDTTTVPQQPPPDFYPPDDRLPDPPPNLPEPKPWPGWRCQPQPPENGGVGIDCPF